MNAIDWTSLNGSLYVPNPQSDPETYPWVLIFNGKGRGLPGDAGKTILKASAQPTELPDIHEIPSGEGFSPGLCLVTSSDNKQPWFLQESAGMWYIAPETLDFFPFDPNKLKTVDPLVFANMMAHSVLGEMFPPNDDQL